MKRTLSLIIAFTIGFSLCACASDKGASTSEGTSSAPSGSGEGDGGKELTYEQISPEEAKVLMESERGCVIIDARTEEEFAQGHIEGAILIPEYEIASRAERELPDKDALILVYCRSGRRSKIASEELVKLGYTNVKEFGGIIDWPYETVR